MAHERFPLNFFVNRIFFYYLLCLGAQVYIFFNSLFGNHFLYNNLFHTLLAFFSLHSCPDSLSTSKTLSYHVLFVPRFFIENGCRKIFRLRIFYFFPVLLSRLIFLGFISRLINVYFIFLRRLSRRSDACLSWTISYLDHRKSKFVVRVARCFVEHLRWQLCANHRILSVFHRFQAHDKHLSLF